MKNLINKVPMYISNIDGQTNFEKSISFMFYVPNTDTYYFSSKEAHKITIYDENEKELISGNIFSLTLDANKKYYVEIETLNPLTDFYLSVKSHNKHVDVPYDINIEHDGKDIPLAETVKGNPLKPALIEAKKRNGGTYLYSNIPEAMPIEAVGSILMQNKDISGDCFLTIEHQNCTGLPYVYMGYRICNTNDHDLYVTVRNIGYQVDGSWLGEKSWMDYYGVKYKMNIESFNEEKKKWFKDYLNFDINYIPNPMAPTTYRIPSGKYIYVMGGTTEDAYKNINVNNSANLPIKPHCCANGNAFFTLINGSANGELCAYVDHNTVNSKDTPIQNFRRYGEKDDMGGRIGSSNHHGVIDINPVWVFNDETPSQNLPVKYYPYYADSLKDKYEPLEPIVGSYKHEYVGDAWKTHLSSQLHHDYLGEDIVENDTYWNGKEIHLSPNMANPAGNIWDFGNWMIEYQENCVFVNQGDKDRKLRFYLSNAGSLFVIIKDEFGNILDCVATLITCTGKKEIYECVIPAHTRKIVSVQFVLAANNGGSVVHEVELI